MPTYEYRCTECGEDLEVVQSIQDEPLTECPTCGGRLRKVFSPIGIAFKGSGFYKTDSRSSARSSGNGKSGESGSSDSGSSGESSKSSPGSSSDSSSSSSGSSDSGTKTGSSTS